MMPMPCAMVMVRFYGRWIGWMDGMQQACIECCLQWVYLGDKKIVLSSWRRKWKVEGDVGVVDFIRHRHVHI